MPRDYTTEQIDKALKKLKRPPQPHNFVRNIFDNLDKTAKSLAELAVGFPRYTYSVGNKVAKDIIELGIDDETALKACREYGAVNSRPLNQEYIEAVLQNRSALRVDGRKSFDYFVSPYRVNADVSIPVKPLSILLDDGRFRTIGMAGWSSLPFTDFKWRLLFSILEDAVFSLEDFYDAHGDFYVFPRARKDDKSSRKLTVASRGDFELFSSAQLREIMDTYVKALAKAEEILRAKTVRKEDAKSRDSAVILPLFPLHRPD